MSDLLRTHKALADETRLRLVRLLSRGALNVAELIRILQMGQSRVSRHLRILADAGLVTSRREGTWIYYERMPGLDADLTDDMLSLVDRYEQTIPHIEADVQALEEVIEQRREQTRTYFDSVDDPHELLRHHSLAAEFYRDVAISLLPPKCGVILDMGTGSGLLLPSLLERTDKVIAVDSSTAMLDLARRNAGPQISRCDLRLGDLEHLPVADGEVEAIMACMVLHHISHPEDVLREAHRALRPGGHLVIVDLHQHEDEAMRERFADLWLGFRPADMKRWLEAAKLTLIDSTTIEPAVARAVANHSTGSPGGSSASLQLITLQGQKPWGRNAKPRAEAAKTTR